MNMRDKGFLIRFLLFVPVFLGVMLLSSCEREKELRDPDNVLKYPDQCYNDEYDEGEMAYNCGGVCQDCEGVTPNCSPDSSNVARFKGNLHQLTAITCSLDPDAGSYEVSAVMDGDTLYVRFPTVRTDGGYESTDSYCSADSDAKYYGEIYYDDYDYSLHDRTSCEGVAYIGIEGGQRSVVVCGAVFIEETLTTTNRDTLEYAKIICDG